MNRNIYFGEVEITIKKVKTIVEAVFNDNSEFITHQKVKYHEFKVLNKRVIGQKNSNVK